MDVCKVQQNLLKDIFKSKKTLTYFLYEDYVGFFNRRYLFIHYPKTDCWLDLTKAREVNFTPLIESMLDKYEFVGETEKAQILHDRVCIKLTNESWIDVANLKKFGAVDKLVLLGDPKNYTTPILIKDKSEKLIGVVSTVRIN